jgi:putative flippase GtrA
LIKVNEIQKQFLKYLFVGVSSAATELLLFTFFTRIVHLNLTTSNIIATIIATGFNFTINRGWSFKNSSSLPRSLVLYLTLFGFNLVFSTNAITMMVRFGVIDVFAKFITMVLITLWNFVLYRKVIFK